MSRRSDIALTPVHANDVAVDATSGGVVLAAANAHRRGLIVQNTGAQPIRVSLDGIAPTASHGHQLLTGASLVILADAPRLVVKAIREGGSSSTAQVTEFI